MIIYIIIPAHNEGNCIGLMLNSLAAQTVLPKKVVVVNDNSTDNTQVVIDRFSAKNNWLQSITIQSSKEHIPGSKVVNAFYKGLETLDENYDIICKFDADIILPKNYLETLTTLFKSNKKTGLASGILYIQKNEKWIYEPIALKTHVRGPIKAYRKACFKSIGGLKKSIGWDTLDVLLAQYHGWIVKTNTTLKVKHLKPTGKTYHKKSNYLQGEALYKMRYGFSLLLISALKGAFKRKSILYFTNTVIGFFIAKKKNVKPIVSKKEGAFIRQLRWQGIKQKLRFIKSI